MRRLTLRRDTRLDDYEWELGYIPSRKIRFTSKDYFYRRGLFGLELHVAWLVSDDPKGTTRTDVDTRPMVGVTLKVGPDLLQSPPFPKPPVSTT